MENNCVETKNLTLKFGDNTALDDISINFEEGKITGLIGADGSGKTTLLRALIGLLLPTFGEICTLGLNPKNQKELINKQIGYMPQKFGLYEDLSIIENLNLYAELKSIPENEKESIFDKLLTMTDLKRFKKRPAGKLSGGMKQKLGLACALLGNPRLLILDEPSVGVDPISRKELMQMVRDLAGEGTTIIWSTAYLDEAHSFDTTVVLNHGKIIYNGNSNALSPTIQGFENEVIKLMGGYNAEKSKIAENFKLLDINVDYTVEARDLVKRYGDFYAVKNNTFHIKKGEIFGLLGPNGAGKSTSFKMMCGLSTPTNGEPIIMGTSILKNPTKARSYLGYMAQKFSLYTNLTVRQNLQFFAGIYGLKRKERKTRIDEMVKLFELEMYLDRNTSELPLGYKQRLSLACAIMHNPPILFLDEPTSGVDPISRRDFWNHINSLAEKGVTVLITTHFMDEAEFCDRISLFYRGESIAVGTPNDLKRSVNVNKMEDAFVQLIKNYEKEHSQE